MATVTPLLDLRSVKTDGTSPVKFRIRNGSEDVMISTGISLKPEQWDGKNVIAKNHKQGRVLHATIAGRYADIQWIILDRYKNYKDYYHRMNRMLKKLGAADAVKADPSKPGPAPREKAGAFPALSTYYARHSWATIAASLDIPKETIAAGLGHGGNTVTDIYIDFDMKKVDAANRRVIDHLFESLEE